MAMKTKVAIYSKRAFPQEILDELEKLSEISKTEALERALNYLLRELPEKNRSLWAKISYEIELTKFMRSKVFARAGVFAWTLRPRDFKALEAIYNLPSVKTLGDVAEIKEGDMTRQEEKKVEEKESLEAVIDDDYYRVIRGRNVKPYCIIWEGSYLKKEHARKIDEKRLMRRILVRDVAPCIMAAVPDMPYRCLRTVYCIELKKRESEKPEIVEVFNKWLNNEEKAWAVALHYLAGLFNSKLINALYYALFYMSQMSPREGNFRFRSQFLQPLPIVVPKSKGEFEKCYRIAEKSMKMAMISRKTLGRRGKNLEELKMLTKRYRDIQVRIDALVNDLFKAPRIDQEYYLHYLGEGRESGLYIG